MYTYTHTYSYCIISKLIGIASHSIDYLEALSVRKPQGKINVLSNERMRGETWSIAREITFQSEGRTYTTSAWPSWILTRHRNETRSLTISDLIWYSAGEKLVFLTWLLWTLRSFRRFTLHYITTAKYTASGPIRYEFSLWDRISTTEAYHSKIPAISLHIICHKYIHVFRLFLS